jgi:hypothetical protein
MLFLLRLAFWLLLVCLLLPGSREDNRRLINSAERTVSDVRGFCQRNPEVCDDARITMTSLLSKLRSGAELLETWLAQESRKDDEHLGSASETPVAKTGHSEIPAKNQNSSASSSPRLVPKWQDSLNPADKQIPWRGPSGL